MAARETQYHCDSSFANLDMLQLLSSSLHHGPLSTIYQLGPSWHMYLDGDGSWDILLHRALHLKAVHSSLHQVGAQLSDCNDCKWKMEHRNIFKNSQLPKNVQIWKKHKWRLEDSQLRDSQKCFWWPAFPKRGYSMKERFWRVTRFWFHNQHLHMCFFTKAIPEARHCICPNEVRV